MPALPRICSKSKFHVEGQVVRAPFKHQGQTCTFARHNLRSMRCDLCTEDQKAALGLGKERERQVINLKIQWTQEQDVVRREALMTQMTVLLQGTLNLVFIVYSNQFVIQTANNLKQCDDSFTTEESIDFILRCFVEGLFGAETDRDDYLQRLSQPYMNADNNLDFVPIFTEMNGIIRQFLATSPQKGINFIKM